MNTFLLVFRVIVWILKQPLFWFCWLSLGIVMTIGGLLGLDMGSILRDILNKNEEEEDEEEDEEDEEEDEEEVNNLDEE